MKNLYLFVAIAAMALCSNVYGFTSYGYQKYEKETIDTIQGNGNVDLEGTTVTGLVSVNGRLNAEDSSMDSLQVNGQVDLRNCVINNTTMINGSLHAENTKFQKEVSIASKRITFDACSLDSLIVREEKGYTGVQVIDLQNGTKITGPISVESGNGEIRVSSDSQISDQVAGAKVVKK